MPRPGGPRTPLRGLVSCIGLVVLGALTQRSAFVEVPKQELQRRQMAAAIASQVLLGPQSALAGDRDRLSMIIGVRKKFLPRILKSYKELQAAGTVTDEFLDEKKMKKFITALMSYGSIQRMDEAPDKISRKLQADAKEVEQYLVAKDYGKAMETLETYRLDIPFGGGEFKWSDEG